MVAKYNDEYYHTTYPQRNMQLWRYAPANGFDKISHKSGLKYYQKTVPFEELQEIFHPTFYVKWNDIDCYAIPDADKQIVTLWLDEDKSETAKQYGFEHDIEFQDWEKKISFEECTEYWYAKFYPCKKEDDLEIITVSKEEWLRLYDTFEIGQMLPSNL